MFPCRRARAPRQQVRTGDVAIPGEIHPPDLDVSRLSGEIVGIEVGQRGLEDALAIHREVLALREHERDRKHRQETVLNPVRRAAPRIVNLGNRHRTLGIRAQEGLRSVPQRDEIAGIVARLRCTKAPALGGLPMQPGPLEQRDKKATYGWKPIDPQPLFGFMTHHSPQESISGRDGVARRQRPREQFVAKTRSA